MQVDRALFLSFVAALSAVTCVPKSERREAAPARAIDVAPASSSPRVEVDRDAAPACDEGVDSTASCDALKPPGPACESFSETIASCKRAKTLLRPAAADRVVRCLLARNETDELCWLFRRGNPVAFCFGDSMRAPCTDKQADTECAKLVAELPAQDTRFREPADLKSTCRSAVAAVRDPGPMLKCMSEEMPTGALPMRVNATACYEWLDGRP